MIENSRLCEMEMKVGNDDEYESMTWGSSSDIKDLLIYVRELQGQNNFEINTVLGLTLKNIEDMKHYFAEKLININELGLDK